MSVLQHLDALEERLLALLRQRLETEHPEAVAALDNAKPQETYKAAVEVLNNWTGSLDFPPTQPHCTTLAGLLALQVRIEEVHFMLEQFENVKDPRGAWFFYATIPLVLTSCLENMEFVVKKMSRGKAPLITKDLADELCADLAHLIEDPRLRALRVDSAHGYHRSAEDGWLNILTARRGWEGFAVLKTGPNEAAAGFLHDAISRRDSRYRQAADGTIYTLGSINRIARLLVAALE